MWVYIYLHIYVLTTYIFTIYVYIHIAVNMCVCIYMRHVYHMVNFFKNCVKVVQWKIVFLITGAETIGYSCTHITKTQNKTNLNFNIRA